MKILRDHRGHRIRLTDERLGHIVQHPEMLGLETSIAESLQAPEFVVESMTDPEVWLYYRRYPATLVGDKYLCVVIKVRGDDAFVVTAYLTDAIKKGRRLWPDRR